MRRKKLTRMQLRRLLLHEVRILSGQQSRRNHLNEGVVLTTLAFIGLGALTALGIYIGANPPDFSDGAGGYGHDTADKPHPSDGNPSYVPPAVKSTLEDIGKDIQSGKTAQQAVISGLKKNAAAASQISAMSKKNGGRSIEQAIGPIDDVGGDLQSRRYGAQDPTEAGYTGLGLPWPFGGRNEESGSDWGDDEGDDFG